MFNHLPDNKKIKGHLTSTAHFVLQRTVKFKAMN